MPSTEFGRVGVSSQTSRYGKASLIGATRKQKKNHAMTNRLVRKSGLLQYDFFLQQPVAHSCSYLETKTYARHCMTSPQETTAASHCPPIRSSASINLESLDDVFVEVIDGSIVQMIGPVGRRVARQQTLTETHRKGNQSAYYVQRLMYVSAKDNSIQIVLRRPTGFDENGARTSARGRWSCCDYRALRGYRVLLISRFDQCRREDG